MAKKNNTESRPAKLLAAILAVGLAATLTVTLAAVYVMFDTSRNGQGPASVQRETGPAQTADTSKRLNRGQMATFVIKKPQPLPELNFINGEGKKLSLADWRGKVVLINIWATWCGPCRHEMPSLAKLDKALEGEPFDVLAISIDRKGLSASRKFLEEINVADQLGLYLDPEAKANFTLKAHGLPASILMDRQGREIGRLAGPADWASEDAIRLIRAAIAGKLQPGG